MIATIEKVQLVSVKQDSFNDGKQDVKFAYCILSSNDELYRMGVDIDLVEDLKKLKGKNVSLQVGFRASADKNVRPKVVAIL